MDNTFDPNRACVFIDNAYVDANRNTVEAVNPDDLSSVGVFAESSVPTIERAIATANRAQSEWSKLDAKTRATHLHRIADSIERSDFHEVARLMTLQMGKPFPEAEGELANVAGAFRYFAEMARDDGGHIAGTTQHGSFQYCQYQPYGVSVHIMPFNFPILLMAWTVAASLAAGNCCVVKPAESTTLCTLAFMRHFQSLPDGAVNLVSGGAAVARALIQSRDTHVVAFTGGVTAGRAVNVACAEQFKPCLIEAGGSDPMIISDKAPIDVAVAGSCTAAFHLSGQICTSAERFFVHESVHDEFVEKLAHYARALRIGPGLGESEIGPLVSEAARDKVSRLVDAAVDEGATLVCGGRVPPDFPVGWYYEPTILTDLSADNGIFAEEIFGPVAAICKVKSFDQALRLANDSPFGLGASVFTTDLDEAMRAADLLQSGMVWVNNPLIDNDALPFGGWKMSGLGRELGRQGLNAFRQSKMVIIDHQPKVHDWWYPYDNAVFYPHKHADKQQRETRAS